MGLQTETSPGLRALPFSLDTLEATGQSFPIDETGRTPSVSRDGTLVYTDGAAGGAPPAIRVVENWYEEFRDRAQ